MKEGWVIDTRNLIDFVEGEIIRSMSKIAV